jgi:four helix bundle protein
MRQLDSLDAYRVARGLSSRAYRLTTTGAFRRHLPLADQIRRAAISIPANIAEGYALGTRPQLVRHLRIALGSGAELRSHLRLLTDLKLVQRSEVEGCIGELDRLISLIVGLLKRAGAQPQVL